MSARRVSWWTAAAGALAASVVWAIVLAVKFDAPAEPKVMLTLNESRDVSVVIDSERDLEDATIRLFVTGGVEFDGFGAQRQVEWLASLNEGANLLSLPVIARSPGDALLIAEIEHEGRTRRVVVGMQVLATRSTTSIPSPASAARDIAS